MIGEKVFTLNGDFDSVRSISLTPDDRIQLFHESGKLTTWEAPPVSAPTVVGTHDLSVDSVAFALSGDRIASVDGAGTILIWELATGEKLATLKGHTDNVNDIVFSPNGCQIASVSNDETVRIWDLSGRQPPVILRGHRTWVESVRYSPDGALLASATHWRNGAVRIWDVASGAQLVALEGGFGSLGFDAKGTRLFAAYEDKLFVWKTKDWEQVTNRVIGDDNVEAMALSGDGRRLGIGRQNGAFDILAADTGKLIHRSIAHTDWIDSVAASRDGKRFATASWDGSIVLWSAETGNVERVYRYNGPEPRCIALSPDGQNLVSGDSDGRVRLWSIARDATRAAKKAG